MSLHERARRFLAGSMLLAVLAAQLMPLPCMMPSVAEAEPAAVATHDRHHGSSTQSPPVEDHSQPAESSHAGQSDCTMMLSCVMVMTLAQSAPAEAVFELSPDGRPTSSQAHVGPLLSQ